MHEYGVLIIIVIIAQGPQGGQVSICLRWSLSPEFALRSILILPRLPWENPPPQSKH